MIARHKIILPVVLLLVTLRNVAVAEEVEEPKDDLEESESKDPSKVEIIKQIKRVNEDGSYTFGYEAEDGTFKIESRDVLGNVKGTFGFVDSNGEIKRVTYSSSNTTEIPTSTTVDKGSVIQQIPRNRTATTRRPTIVYPTASQSSTVIQSIPKRRLGLNNNNTSSQSTSTTEKPLKHILKTSEFISSSTEPTSVRSFTTRPVFQNGHFVRSTLSPPTDTQRYTEGQLIRPTQSDSVTPRPNDNSFIRRVVVSRNPLLEEQIASTIKPVLEDIDSGDNVRGNILRRQLSQEKIANYDARQHVLNLHQSTGDDSADVYGGSLTTGTPRPLFTTTNRPRIVPTPTASAKLVATQAKYPVVFQKNAIRGPRPSTTDGFVQETTTDATVTESSYVTPNPIPVLQVPNPEESIPILRRHPYHRGAILVPVNQIHNGRYLVEDPNADPNYPHHILIPHPPEQQYIRDAHPHFVHPSQIQTERPIPIPIVIAPRRQIPIPDNEYQRSQVPPEYVPRPFPIALNLMQLQDEVDRIKPPVSTHDFQKLLNRLILRQNHLREITRLEQQRMLQEAYYNQDNRFRSVQPTPVSIFVRRPENQGGPVQFIPAQQAKQRSFIAVPTPASRIESDQYNSPDTYPDNYSPPLYRSGRRAARLLDPNTQQKPNEGDNYLPAEVREMLLLRMLQLAINPNLPVPAADMEVSTTAIPPHRKEPVRNVQIIGEDQEENKQNRRHKRYEVSEGDDYY